METNQKITIYIKETSILTFTLACIIYLYIVIVNKLMLVMLLSLVNRNYNDIYSMTYTYYTYRPVVPN